MSPGLKWKGVSIYNDSFSEVVNEKVSITKPMLLLKRTNQNNYSFIFTKVIHSDYNQYKVKQMFYDTINFYFGLSRTFPIVKNSCLQHYVHVFNKNIY